MIYVFFEIPSGTCIEIKLKLFNYLRVFLLMLYQLLLMLRCVIIDDTHTDKFQICVSTSNLVLICWNLAFLLNRYSKVF